ncbi:DegT/DnrJ/EryC1/StrS family aminotransferase [Hyphobacterium sp. CCMP332]|nr:DegT/DnrJ/EryC1/StrS family aminotransferase [Hyphobacterium sp. CCMP332]
MIPVTKPYLPSKEKFKKYVDDIWKRQWLTNNGPLVNEFELLLKEYLKVEHLAYVGNGTIALQIAIKALELKGEIITTPFSYVATSSSIVWEQCKPIYVDISPETFNIDPSKIEESITHKTSAILATHCFGNPCDIESIEKIANKHKLKVIYDAAHCFGTNYKGKSILEYGDLSTLSLHATKIMHSTEGGLIVTRHPEILKKVAFMRNFGHSGPTTFHGLGINGKNSEFHAAMGLCVLEDIDLILESRKEQSKYYDMILKPLVYKKQQIESSCDYNFSYYPILLNDEQEVLEIKKVLEEAEIFPRRYFYPSLSKLDYVTQKETPISDDISSRILCLPLYHDLTKEEQDMISRLMQRTQKYGL